MKTRTINAVLSKKFNEWLNTIEDPAVQTLARKGTIITGGCIASMLLQEEVNDYDMYFKDQETCLAVAQYYVAEYNAEHPGSKFKVAVGDQIISEEKDNGTMMKEVVIDPTRVKIIIPSRGITNIPEDPEFIAATDPMEVANQVSDFMTEADQLPASTLDGTPNGILDGPDVKKTYKVAFMSSNAITLTNKVQLVIRFHGNPTEIHDNYDFIHCTNYWTSWEGNVVLNQKALESLLTKELRYVGSKYPVCSIIRTRKFIARHWTINAGQYLKMIMQVSKLDLENVAVLEDQLIGVDSAYFMQVITALKEKGSERVDSGYLMTVLDRVF